MTAGEAEEGVRNGSAEPQNSDLEISVPPELGSESADRNINGHVECASLPVTPKLAAASSRTT